jgi:hypothetical protein
MNQTACLVIDMTKFIADDYMRDAIKKIGHEIKINNIVKEFYIKKLIDCEITTYYNANNNTYIATPVSKIRYSTSLDVGTCKRSAMYIEFDKIMK